MRPASPQLIALLDSNAFKYADLYTITTNSGQIYRYTNCDVNLVVDNEVYIADEIQISRDSISISLGVSVDNLNIKLSSINETYFNGKTIVKAFRQGIFDNAKFKLDRVFLDSDDISNTSAGVIALFEGTIVEPEISDFSIDATVVSLTDKLKVKLPRNLFQPSCQNSLFDSGCTLNPSLFVESGTTLAGSSTNLIACTLTKPQNWFTQGVVIITSGLNAGVKRTVRLHNSTGLLLTLPFEYPMAPGDTFQVFPGCDKRIQTCKTRFLNESNFKGTPYVPVPETAV